MPQLAMGHSRPLIAATRRTARRFAGFTGTEWPHACFENLLALLNDGMAPRLIDAEVGSNEERYRAAITAARLTAWPSPPR